MPKAAFSSQMGRLATEVCAAVVDRAAVTELSGHWTGRVHGALPLKWITLDIDSSVMPATTIYPVNVG